MNEKILNKLSDIPNNRYLAKNKLIHLFIELDLHWDIYSREKWLRDLFLEKIILLIPFLEYYEVEINKGKINRENAIGCGLNQDDFEKINCKLVSIYEDCIEEESKNKISKCWEIKIDKIFIVGIKWSYKDKDEGNKAKYYEIGFLRNDERIGLNQDHFEKFIDTFVYLINDLIKKKE